MCTIDRKYRRMLHYYRRSILTRFAQSSPIAPIKDSSKPDQGRSTAERRKQVLRASLLSFCSKL
jgi:hypothetical protein